MIYKTDIAEMFIDGQNIYYMAKDLNLHIDYKRLSKYFGGLFKLNRIRYYSSVRDNADDTRVPLIDFLTYNGYHTTIKYSKNYNDRDEETKGNYCVDLTVDALTASKHVDTIVLFVGSAQYSPLIDELQRRGKNIMIVGTDKHISPDLKRLADRYLSIESIRDSIENISN